MEEIERRAAADRESTEEPEALLEMERRAGAGKDRKITEMAAEIAKLKETITGGDPETASTVNDLAEMAISLQAERKLQEAQREAINAAVEHGINTRLAMFGAGPDFEAYLGMLEDFGRTYAQRRDVAGAPTTGTPARLRFSDMANMSPQSMLNLSSRVRDRLLVNSNGE